MGSALRSGLDSKVGSSLILDIADMSFSASVDNKVTILAYGFWHAPYVDIDVSEYENALLGFHEDLMADPPAGFERPRPIRSPKCLG